MNETSPPSSQPVSPTMLGPSRESTHLATRLFDLLVFAEQKVFVNKAVLEGRVLRDGDEVVFQSGAQSITCRKAADGVSCSLTFTPDEQGAYSVPHLLYLAMSRAYELSPDWRQRLESPGGPEFPEPPNLVPTLRLGGTGGKLLCRAWPNRERYLCRFEP